MSKKKEIKKDLQKRLFAIAEIYAGQKGKAKRKQLTDFIDKKMGEIILFRDSLVAKKPVAKNSEIIMPAAAALEPSSALVEQLNNHS